MANKEFFCFNCNRHLPVSQRAVVAGRGRRYSVCKSCKGRKKARIKKSLITYFKDGDVIATVVVSEKYLDMSKKDIMEDIFLGLVKQPTVLWDKFDVEEILV